MTRSRARAPPMSTSHADTLLQMRAAELANLANGFTPGTASRTRTTGVGTVVTKTTEKWIAR